MRIKSFMIVLALFCALAAVSAVPAFAQQEDKRVDKLLELLIQKGVITSQDASDLKKAVTEEAAKKPAPPPINISGYAKLQGLWIKNDPTLTSSDTFRVRAARVQLSGQPAPNYSYKITMALERTDPVLLDASVNWDISKKHSLTFGQMKVPVSRECQLSDKDLDLLERPWFLDQFRPPNTMDIGVLTTYKSNPNLKFELGVFNGNGKNMPNVNDQFMWAGRLSGKLMLGKIQLEPEAAYINAKAERGLAAYSPPIEVNPKALIATPYDKGEKQWGLAASYKDYSLKYEYMMGRFKPQNPALATVLAAGGSLTFGKTLCQKFALHFRIEDYDPNLRSTTAADTKWLTLGLSYNPFKNVRYKLNYVWKKEAISSVKNDQLGAQAIFEF